MQIREERMVTMSLNVEPELWQQLRAIAVREVRPLAWVTRELLREALAAREKT